MSLYLRFVLLCFVLSLAFPLVRAQDNTDPLVRVLVTKGVLTPEEARLIGVNASPAEQRDRLAVLLRDKGVISATEFEAVRTSSSSLPEVKTMTADYKTTTPLPPVAPQPQATPAVIAAVAPVRLQGIDPPKRE